MKQVVRIILAAAALAALAAPALAADKLVVKDAAGTNTMFVVTDSGSTGIGTSTPASMLDVRDTKTVDTALQQIWNTGFKRTSFNSNGIQSWYLGQPNGSGEIGAIKYSTPGGGVGIGFFTGATYDQNQVNIALYPTLGTGGAAIAGIGFAVGPGLITVDKTTGNIGLGTLYAANPPTNKLDIDGNSIRIRTSQSPASTAACNAGAIAWDASNIYVCTASGVWKKAALSAY